MSHKKVIRPELLNLIGIEELAIWWMDDGCLTWDKRCHSGVLSVCEFSKSEVELIINWIFQHTGAKGRFNSRFNKQRSKAYPVIVFNSQEVHRLIEQIKPYALDGMLYKFDLSRRPSLPRGPRIGKNRSNVFSDKKKIQILKELKNRSMTQKQIAEKNNCSVSLLEKVQSGSLWRSLQKQ